MALKMARKFKHEKARVGLFFLKKKFTHHKCILLKVLFDVRAFSVFLT